MSLSNFSFAFYAPAEDPNGPLQRVQVAKDYSDIDQYAQVVALAGTANFIATVLDRQGIVITHAHMMSGDEPLGKPVDLFSRPPAKVARMPLGGLKSAINRALLQGHTDLIGAMAWCTDECVITPVSDIWHKIPLLARRRICILDYRGKEA